MADTEEPRRTTLSPVRLAANDAPQPPMDAALRALAEALELVGPARAKAEAVLVQRLGDERTLALLAGGDPRAVGALLKAAASSAAPADSLRLGQILVAQGLVAPRRLEAALDAQKATQRRIGAELVAAGHIDAREVAQALWLQHKLAAAARELAARLADVEAISPPRLIAARAP
jgi:hypothetical protein